VFFLFQSSLLAQNQEIANIIRWLGDGSKAGFSHRTPELLSPFTKRIIRGNLMLKAAVSNIRNIITNTAGIGYHIVILILT